MQKLFFRNSVVIILTAVMMFVLSACATEESKKTENYVSSVKVTVNDCVNNTRILRTDKEKFDCKDSEISKKYISTIETLIDLYEDIIKLEAPDSYNDLDAKVRAEAENALSQMTELRSLVQYAFSKNDDSLYKKDIDEIYESYQKSYNELISLSSEVQTRFRNA